MKRDWWVKAQKAFNKVLQDCKTDFDVLLAQEQVVCRIRTMVHYRRMALMIDREVKSKVKEGR